ncbi:MAG: DNA repair protein RadA [Oscillospiraceae bacterium]|nr:DNA repair protein RadA [Oscillospiraceae bacterium]
MAKLKEIYVCTQCGYESAKWSGQCSSCGAWNTLEQTVKAPEKPLKSSVAIGADLTPVKVSDIDIADKVRYKTGMDELDRVLGGGIVKGSLVLLGGDPGIGKSTLMLQICQKIGQNHSILYVSGEESGRQIKLRADRLGVDSQNLNLVSCTDIDTIVALIEKYAPDVVMIDSIQTMSCAGVASCAGSVAQVRECTNALMQVAKSREIPILIVGHVNKDGAIAGPKVLEHMVDAVLYFEGDKQFAYRILRGVKNRFGSTNEIGVFEMRDKGLCEISNPSAHMLSGRPGGVPGTCVVCIMEGTRPILVEVQSLVSKTNLAVPRRVCTGFDYNRMAMIIAVLEKRAGYLFGQSDAYVNVVGGLKLYDTAADLAIAMALVSSLREKPIGENIIVFGELGLAGEVRSVSQANDRVKEAKRLGFKKCIVPSQSLLSITETDGIEVVGVKDIKQAFMELSK